MELKFSIKHINLLESHFKLNPEFQPKEGEPIEISSNVGIGYGREKNLVSVILGINSDGKGQPFTLNVSFRGVFHFEKLPPKKELDRIAKVNCAAILFPYARETVADLTRRAGIPPFHVNPVNFVAAYSQLESRVARKKTSVVSQ